MATYNDVLAANNSDEKTGASYDDVVKASATDSPLYKRLSAPSAGTRVGRVISDIGVTATKGAVGLVNTGLGIADIATAGAAGKTAEKFGYDPKVINNYLESQYSPEQQAANRNVASAQGFVPTLKAYAENPSAIVHQAAEQVPAIIAGGKIGGAVTNALRNYAPKAAGVIGAGVGEGVITAGQNIEEVRQQTPGGELSAGQILPVVGSAAVTGAIGGLGAKLATKYGLSDPEALATGLVADTTTKPLSKAARIPLSIAAEGTEELLQSPQEQIASNIALNKPTFEGVPEAAAQGLVLGSAMGAGSVAVDPETYRANEQPPSLTKAAQIAVDSGATEQGRNKC